MVISLFLLLDFKQLAILNISPYKSQIIKGMPNIVDKILNYKIGLGKSQYLSFIFISLVDVNDGVQAIISSLTIGIIEKQWKLEQEKASAIASIFFFGAFLGCLLSGKFSDLYGRRPSVIIGSIMQVFAAIFFLFIKSYAALIIARGLYGITFGFTLSQTTTYITQTFPSAYRGKGLVLLNFCASFGKLFGLLICSFFMTDFTTGNWHLMVLVGCTPNIIIFIGSLLVLKQTPRYLIAVKEFDKAYEVLEGMALANEKIQEGDEFLTEEEKNDIVEYQNEIYTGIKKADFKSLFNKTYLQTTICLTIAWFAINFMYYGQLIVLPEIFGKEDKTLWSYALTVAGEMPTIFATLLIIDRPGFGRKKSLIYIFFISALFHGIFALDSIVAISTICRFFMKMIYQVLYPCTSESYGTLNRSLGFGFTSGIGRIGSAIMPFIVLPLAKSNPAMVSVCFLICSISGGISSFFLPHEPLGRALDQYQQGIQMPNDAQGRKQAIQNKDIDIEL